MAKGKLYGVIQYLRDLVPARETAGRPDSELLEQFVTRHDAAPFEALVRRHGPMVLGVCRRVLPNPHDAEDAFHLMRSVVCMLLLAGCSAAPAADLSSATLTLSTNSWGRTRSL